MPIMGMGIQLLLPVPLSVPKGISIKIKKKLAIINARRCSEKKSVSMDEKMA